MRFVFSTMNFFFGMLIFSLLTYPTSPPQTQDVYAHPDLRHDRVLDAGC